MCLNTNPIFCFACRLMLDDCKTDTTSVVISSGRILGLLFNFQGKLQHRDLNVTYLQLKVELSGLTWTSLLYPLRSW